jgi:hypothetical protein
MSNRTKLFVGIAAFLAIVVSGAFLIWPQRAKRQAQPPAEKVATGNFSQTPAANPQQQVNLLIVDGDRMMEDGDYVDARSFYEAALKLDPSNTAARAGIKNAEDSIKKSNH